MEKWRDCPRTAWDTPGEAMGHGLLPPRGLVSPSTNVLWNLQWKTLLRGDLSGGILAESDDYASFRASDKHNDDNQKSRGARRKENNLSFLTENTSVRSAVTVSPWQWRMAG
uniref:Uncharacterized protein n=1 Tax=Steinernema glaseri TaxID=37863 RepID=A0A1I7YQ33_9BILA